MKFRHLFFVALLTSSSLISGCSGIQVTKTPAGNGSDAGDYFVQEWKKTSEKSGQKYPSPEFPATYCGNLAYDIGVKEGWDMQEQLEFSKACTDSVLVGLGLN